MSGTILRRAFVDQQIEVPDGQKPCPRCEGRGNVTKYELGWSSLVHDPSFAAPEACYSCGGLGYVPE